MTIELDCEECGYHLRVADKYAGQEGKCKRCGAKIVAVAKPKPVPAPLQPPNPLRREKAPALPYKWIAGTALGLALIGFAFYLLFLLAGGEEPEIPTTPPPTSIRSE